MTERLSPLDQVHRSIGAKMVPFGGWDMPLSYADGTLAEHRACRHSAVIFDVSHLGTVRVTGADAFAVLQRAFTNDLNRVEPGRAQYTHLLDEETASVVDDIIIWWVDPETFDVMPNASNTDRVTGAIEEIAQSLGGVSVEAGDVTAERAILAVQGPQARALLESIDPAIASVARFDVRRVEWNGIGLVVAGTGYTGEDGVEIAVPAAHAAQLWNAIVDTGVTPAGLGARDTLRLEAGLPLHGHELGSGITSLQAGLGWAVRFDKGPFRGSEALAEERDRGVTRRLFGLVTEGRRPPREGSAILFDGAIVGEVTSGNFSPELGHGIALGFLPPDSSVGDKFEIDVRGTMLEARVVKTPFVH
ncbi:MAG: glycine cleavage system aminomethyltransferase GcvT [Actinobacteria bacterium]|uniref:aminomethyltransferase n=1 Tax=freshwater metagenome TaxID=449393 RepID=A0A6J5ZQD8_9ZZZZ|nr:glycine cleavage system aminomethyltransferase GcvT [Actinomycetota bacterium]MSX34317.1 glycine cleavage system aminomethyltransferase GcvT [Actinomycetota bacterium]MSY24324.1 glycine cleavage system aminomethyltransferase GcvT [Actinomycetota bacterium]MSZ53059.1 glycine cleavage system aminomethyltransferase GcvT [Actinomycetota bacterium]MTA41592.1 glycine cleavage system aminomethyltransferase GcvT [Actinomycetota bacterium]